MNDHLRTNLRHRTTNTPAPIAVTTKSAPRFERFPVKLLSKGRKRILPIINKLVGEYRDLNQHQRITAAILAFLMISAIGIQALEPFTSARAYALSSATRQIIGESREDTKEYLKLNKENTAYEFTVPKSNDPNAVHGGRNNAVYSTSLSTNADDGITYTDTATDIGITVVPKFNTADGKKVDGDSIIYPSGADQLVYTHKYNGLKEDIIVPNYRKDSLSYQFELQLPAGAEARLDATGNIGIYSSDPTLFGDISFGSDTDRAKLEKAREKGNKTNLIAVIPSPIIKDAKGKEYTNKASFRLSGKITKQMRVTDKNVPAEVAAKFAKQATKNIYTLSISAKQLKDLPYPISLDPTIQTSSASDFAQGNFDGTDIDVTNSLIRRGALTGGALNTFVSQANILQVDTEKFGMYAYKDKLYSVQYGAIYYSSINTTDGSLSSMTASSSYSTGWGTGTAFYNGYLYSSGGQGTGSAPRSDVRFAKINSDGTVGAWTVTSSLVSGRWAHGMTAYNGYVYVASGCILNGTDAFGNNNGICTTNTNTVEYAQIKGDGSLGTWATTTSTSVSSEPSVTGYNGYLYVIESVNSYYARINTDGSVGTWQTITGLTSNFGQVATAASGYLYVLGGDNQQTVFLAPIAADGSVGTWSTTSSLSVLRDRGAATVYNGYLYVAGGHDNATPTRNFQRSVERAKIDPAGSYSAFVSSADLDTNGRFGHASVVYNGYLYVLGGSTSSQVTGFVNTIRKAAINSDGTLGTWASGGTSFTNGRIGFSAVVYAGYMYIAGGYGTCGFLGANGYCSDIQSSFIDLNTGNLGSWTNGTTLPSARAYHATAIYNQYLYLIAGDTGSGAVNSTVYVALASSGAVGTWQTNAPNLPVALTSPGAVASGGYLYVVGGGTSANAITNLIRYTTINLSSGLPGSWSTVDPGTPSDALWGTQRMNQGVFVYNGYLYQAQGCVVIASGSCTNATADVQFLKINADGSPSTWVAARGRLSTGFMYFQGTAMYNGVIYSTGGLDSTPRKDVQIGRIYNGGAGQLGTWATNSTSTNTAHGGGGLVVSDGYVYIMGGSLSGGSGTAAVEYAPILSGGGVGTFVAGPSLPSPAARPGAAISNNYVYVGAGSTTGVIYGKINPATHAFLTDAGCGSAWCTVTTALNSDCCTQVNIYNGYIYIMTAGYTGVVYAKLNGDGTIGTLSSTVTFNVSRGGAAGTIANGYYYVFGGYHGGGPTIVENTVEISKINSDGSLSAFTYTTGFMADPDSGRWGSSAFAANGYMYQMGGTGISGMFYGLVAPILQNGQLGQWTKTTQYTNVRIAQRLFVDNGYLYQIGGCSGSTCGTAYSDVQSAPLKSISRSGTYSRLIDFDKGVRPTKLITRGSKLLLGAVNVEYSTTNNSATSLGNGQTSTDISYDGANALMFNLGTNRTLSRYLYLSYEFDDTQAATFPDSAGGQSTITDYDLYFTPNPGSRLRGGQTFTGQKDRGLESQ